MTHDETNDEVVVEIAETSSDDSPTVKLSDSVLQQMLPEYRFDYDRFDPIEILDIDSLCSRDACVVRLTVSVQGQITPVYGTSRRFPKDKPDAELAIMLATARAYESLAKKIKKRATGRVKHHDDMRAQRPFQIEKSRNYFKINANKKASKVDWRKATLSVASLPASSKHV